MRVISLLDGLGPPETASSVSFTLYSSNGKVFDETRGLLLAKAGQGMLPQALPLHVTPACCSPLQDWWKCMPPEAPWP